MAALLLADARARCLRHLRQQLGQQLIGIPTRKLLELTSRDLMAECSEYLLPTLQGGRHAIEESAFDVENDRLRRAQNPTCGHNRRGEHPHTNLRPGTLLAIFLS